MIIKRNYFTKYLENKITKEQNLVLQNTPGFRIKYVNMLSILTELMERDYHWSNTYNCSWDSNFYALIPETFKKIYEEKLSLRFPFNLNTNFESIPADLLYKYCYNLNELLFDTISTNKSEDFYNEKYLVKIIENILKVAKFRIDDF